MLPRVKFPTLRLRLAGEAEEEEELEVACAAAIVRGPLEPA